MVNIIFHILRPADESNTWMSMMGQALKSSATYLPVQVTDMFNQGRSFATAHLPVAGMKNVCTIATYVNCHFLIIIT